jgi:hypothetical protein
MKTLALIIRGLEPFIYGFFLTNFVQHDNNYTRNNFIMLGLAYVNYYIIEYYKGISKDINIIYLNIIIMICNQVLYYYYSNIIDLNEKIINNINPIIIGFSASCIYILLTIILAVTYNITNNVKEVCDTVYNRDMSQYILFNFNQICTQLISNIIIISLTYYLIDIYNIPNNNIIVRTLIVSMSTININNFYSYSIINKFHMMSNYNYINIYNSIHVIVTLTNIIMLFILNNISDNDYWNSQYITIFKDELIINHLVFYLITVPITIFTIKLIFNWLSYCDDEYINNNYYNCIINNEIEYLKNNVESTFKPLEFKTSNQAIIEYTEELYKQEQIKMKNKKKKKKKQWYYGKSLKKRRTNKYRH